MIHNLMKLEFLATRKISAPLAILVVNIPRTAELIAPNRLFATSALPFIKPFVHHFGNFLNRYRLSLLLICTMLACTINTASQAASAAKRYEGGVARSALRQDNNDASTTSAASASVASTAASADRIDYAPYLPNMIFPVRVGIACRVPSAMLAVWTPGAVFIDGIAMFALKPATIYLFTPGKLTELATGQSMRLPIEKRASICARDYQVWARNRWWRGTLELATVGRAVTVINLLDMENYLMGVVPAEMPASWQGEALKAQAVAARSYAFAHIGSGSKWFRAEGFDLVPDVRDQAYKGRAAEAASTTMAILETKGVVLQDAGRVKSGFYRASMGDFWENFNMRLKPVSSALLEALTGVSHIVGVTVKQWDSTGQAVSVQVIGLKKSREVDGKILARRLGFDTAAILDIQQQGSNWLFKYRGPGNGARGLSQHGANLLAQKGWNFIQILQQYYQDQGGKLGLASLYRQ